MAKHIANRVHEKFGSSNVLDAFCGVGGNAIQFARKGFCVASDMDLQKVEYAKHNAAIYAVDSELQLVHTDYLRLSNTLAIPHFTFPDNRKQGFDSVFLSPPWGGTGYQFLSEYSLNHIFPDIDKIIQKSLEYSGNLMLFLPKNTSIKEIVDRLLPYHA